MGYLDDAASSLKGIVKEEATEVAKRTALVAFLKGAIEYDKTQYKSDETLEKNEKDKAAKAYGFIKGQKNLVKAALIPRTGEAEAALRINFMFNPSELTFSRDISLTNLEGARTLQGLPKVSFGYVEPYSVQLAGIVFDTYETGINVLDKIAPIRAAMEFANFKTVDTTSVAEYAVRGQLTGIAQAGMEYDDYNMKRPLTTKRPPVYYFMWGEQNYLQCFIQKLNYKLTMFLPDGTPVRAVVDLSLQEVDMTRVAREFSAPQRPTAS